MKKNIGTPFSRILVAGALILQIALCVDVTNAMLITACSKIKGAIIALYENPQPDERDVPEELKVPYIAKIQIKRIIHSKENYEMHEIKRYLNKQIPISNISFKTSSLKNGIKESEDFIGYLYLNNIEYHTFGYKTKFNLMIINQKKWWEFWK